MEIFSNPLFIYISCGVIFNLMMDGFVYILSNTEFEDGEKIEIETWSVFTKLIVTFTWPFSLISLIYFYFKIKKDVRNKK